MIQTLFRREVAAAVMNPVPRSVFPFLRQISQEAMTSGMQTSLLALLFTGVFCAFSVPAQVSLAQCKRERLTLWDVPAPAASACTLVDATLIFCRSPTLRCLKFSVRLQNRVKALL
ncbi:hypothetical protein H6F67_12640 [Microcoleus sp. FACHB-1515]|uniref:hypothetical protein n=1 Tax=Cyanophyceae TaxID=3028117 RepID=UPI001683EE17|nr:hypothetical protein [Microcoleus sp. FACHB-1515]MBD2090702.1 hypothetical protein [Microcoleus sp. FACHB-1515]